MDAAETYLVYSKREVDLPISVRFTVIVQWPLWVKTPRTRRVSATSEPEVIPEGISSNPDIAGRTSEAEG